MKKVISVIIALTTIFCYPVKAYKQDSVTSGDSAKTIVYKFDIKQQIGPAIWRQTRQSFEEADKLNAEYIIIHMNTYGGLVDAADSIRTIILNSKIPVYVFIDNNAASAGALISLACDSIYMRSGANIGAATVVDQSGKPLPDKFQAYMRSTMRSTAEAHGKDTVIVGNDTIIKWFRDPKIAEAMVDPDIYIEGIIDTGKVLTFTTLEAMKYGFCEGQAENIAEVLEKVGVNDYVIKSYKVTLLESIIGFLVNPVVSGLLIMLIIGGIYFELQSPGVGFPLAASIVAATLYFAPLYLEGLAENWEIVVFIIGVLLIGVEIFAIPGFGVAGIGGILLIITGLTLSLVDNVVFTFNIESMTILFRAFFLVIISTFISLVSSIWLASKLLNSSILSFLVLDSTQKREEGFVGVSGEYSNYVGKTGEAATILRPAGKVKIGDDYFDARCQTGYIEKGEKILVIKFITSQLYVKKLDE